MEKFSGENLEQPKITQEEFESLIGAQVAEIRDFFDGGNAEDWINNTREKLKDIENLINSEEAKEFFSGSALESARLAAGNMMKNLDGLDPSMLSKEVKESLIKGLDNLFN